MAVAPMLAPSIGGFLTSVASWRAIFVVSGALGLVSLGLVLRFVPETRVAGDVALGARAGFCALARNRRFRRFAAQGAFAAAAFVTFVSAVPYLMTPREYGLYFMLLSGSFIAGSGFAARRSEQYGNERMVAVGMSGMLLSVVLMGSAFALGFRDPLALFLPAMILTFSQGLAIPNSQAGAIGAIPERAGTASGFSGFLNQWVAAFFTQSVGLLQDGTALPMIALCAICVVCAILVLFLLGDRRGPGVLSPR
jgi:DHA1 family bicyclomycin/chloramphenicol resistance-like MFS transporter